MYKSMIAYACTCMCVCTRAHTRECARVCVFVWTLIHAFACLHTCVYTFRNIPHQVLKLASLALPPLSNIERLPTRRCWNRKKVIRDYASLVQWTLMQVFESFDHTWGLLACSHDRPIEQPCVWPLNFVYDWFAFLWCWLCAFPK